MSKNNRYYEAKNKGAEKARKGVAFLPRPLQPVKGREGAAKTLEYLNEEIDKLVEILKQM